MLLCFVGISRSVWTQSLKQDIYVYVFTLFECCRMFRPRYNLALHRTCSLNSNFHLRHLESSTTFLVPDGYVLGIQLFLPVVTSVIAVFKPNSCWGKVQQTHHSEAVDAKSRNPQHDSCRSKLLTNWAVHTDIWVCIDLNMNTKRIWASAM
jgi:hypothetical protein